MRGAAVHTEVVGRVAVHTRLGTRIIPVNYSIVDDAIVWRTAPYSELAILGPGVEGAFEIDRIDHDLRQGWSVIAHGVLEVVDDPEEVARIRCVEDPAPWAAGLRHLYMRLRYKDLTLALIRRSVVCAAYPSRRPAEHEP